MEKTTRRRLLMSAAASGVAVTGLGMLASEGPALANAHAGHPEPLVGRRAQATVAFGQWDANPDNPFDRQPANSDRTRNIHALLPFRVNINEGGAVSFVISGVHQVVVYDDGFELSDVQGGHADSRRPSTHRLGARSHLSRVGSASVDVCHTGR